MSATLEAILQDLGVGLARRAARRRRAQAATATGLTSLALAAIAVSVVGVATESATTDGSTSTVAGRLIADGHCAPLACWPGDASLNLPKTRQNAAPGAF